MSQHSGSVSLLSEHPASPALLTSHGPHRSHCSTTLRGLWAVGAWGCKQTPHHATRCAVVRTTQGSAGRWSGKGGKKSDGRTVAALLWGLVLPRAGAAESHILSSLSDNRRRRGQKPPPKSRRGPSFSSPPWLSCSTTHAVVAAKAITIGTNTLRKTGRTAVTQAPVVAKKRAWVVRTHSQFEDRLRSWAPQGWPLMRCFTGCNQSSTIFASLDPSYPEGNFEGNQLLGGSIGLSPLCRTQATQFARQNSDRLPPQFPMASS